MAITGLRVWERKDWVDAWVLSLQIIEYHEVVRYISYKQSDIRKEFRTRKGIICQAADCTASYDLQSGLASNTDSEGRTDIQC